MNITVYCGSSMGADPEYRKAAENLGHWMAENGHTLVYGGGNIGLMGIIADVVLEDGGSVIGIIPEFLLEHEKGHTGLHTLEVVQSMHERKARMIELGDAFIAMPGGVGTLEEIAEIISLNRLERIDAKAIFYNINGYYEPMKRVLEQMVENEFYEEEGMRKILFPKDVCELADWLSR